MCDKPNKVYLIQGVIFAVIAIPIFVFALWLIPNTGWAIMVLFSLFWGVLSVCSIQEYCKQIYKYKLSLEDSDAYQKLVTEEKEKRIDTIKKTNKQNEQKEAKKYNYYKYKCPMCGSNKIINVSIGKKAISIEMLGLASDKLGKCYECHDCNYKW